MPGYPNGRAATAAPLRPPVQPSANGSPGDPAAARWLVPSLNIAAIFAPDQPAAPAGPLSSRVLQLFGRLVQVSYACSATNLNWVKHDTFNP